MEELEKRHAEIKLKFEGRINDKDNPNGILTNQLKTYHRCFGQLDREGLKTLMRNDMNLWEEELDEARK